MFKNNRAGIGNVAKEGNAPSGLSKARVEALTDGIFAFAMTLLIMNIELPEAAPVDSAADAATALLMSLAPDFMHYVIAFAVLAGFWVMHHNVFEHIRVIDRRMLWLNIISLLFVALLPFSTDLADTYVDFPASAIFFEMNILMISLLYWVQWSYACGRKEFLRENVSPEHIRVTRMGMLVMPVVSLAGMAIALLGGTWSTAIYIGVPLVYTVWPRLFRGRAEG